MLSHSLPRTPPRSQQVTEAQRKRQHDLGTFAPRRPGRHGRHDAAGGDDLDVLAGLRPRRFAPIRRLVETFDAIAATEQAVQHDPSFSLAPPTTPVPRHSNRA